MLLCAVSGQYVQVYAWYDNCLVLQQLLYLHSTCNTICIHIVNKTNISDQWCLF